MAPSPTPHTPTHLHIYTHTHTYTYTQSLWSAQRANGSRYFIAASFYTFWHQYYHETAPDARHHYEIIHENQPCKLYFGTMMMMLSVVHVTWMDGEVVCFYTCTVSVSVCVVWCGMVFVLVYEAYAPLPHTRLPHTRLPHHTDVEYDVQCNPHVDGAVMIDHLVEAVGCALQVCGNGVGVLVGVWYIGRDSCACILWHIYIERDSYILVHTHIGTL